MSADRLWRLTDREKQHYFLFHWHFLHKDSKTDWLVIGTEQDETGTALYNKYGISLFGTFHFNEAPDNLAT